MKALMIFAGTWVFQDSLASILYYIGKPDQNWHYDHSLRIIRAVVGLALLIRGIRK